MWARHEWGRCVGGEGQSESLPTRVAGLTSHEGHCQPACQYTPLDHDAWIGAAGACELWEINSAIVPGLNWAEPHLRNGQLQPKMSRLARVARTT